MAVTSLSTEAFLSLAEAYPVADVRSPGEYRHACIPGAISLPLFTDEERKVVGTAYKQQNRETAIKIGLDYFGPKMRGMVEEVEELLEKTEDKIILVHCWRGGMRSGAVAWLLDLYGFKVYLLQGGYKAYRSWVLAQFEKSYPLTVIGGYTGSGKTEVLQQLRTYGEPVVDLEALAGHRGSAFGNLGLPPQPGVEQMENHLAMTLAKMEKYRSENGKQTIWVEDESQRIGDINLPGAFFQQLRHAPFIFVQLPFEERLKHIVNIYGRFSNDELANPIQRIRRRLGDQHTRMALGFLEEGNKEGCFDVLLRYYDKFYRNSSFGDERKVQPVEFEKLDAGKIAGYLLNQIKK